MDNIPHSNENVSNYQPIKIEKEDEDISEELMDNCGIYETEMYPTESPEFKIEITDTKIVLGENYLTYNSDSPNEDVHSYNSRNEEDIFEEESSFKYKCELCDYVAESQSHIATHMTSVHSNPKRFKCDLCKYSTNHRNNLRGHMNSVHLNLKKYKCNQCNYAANSKSNLTKHLNGVHLKLKLYDCVSCDYSAFARGTLKKHMNSIHFNLKRYTCHLCNFSSTVKTNIRTHIDFVHSNL